MSENHEKIIKTLKEHPEGLSPKRIAALSGVNHNTVKSAVQRIPEIKKVARGLYKVVDGGDGSLPHEADLSSWSFHNLVLRVDGDFSDCVAWDRDIGVVSFSASVSSRQATLRVSSDFPLNVSALCVVAAWYAMQCGVDWSDVLVSSIEFNKDFRKLRLDGAQSLSVAGLVEQFKLYQKDSGLRVEHKTRVPFPAESIVDLLRQNPMSVDLHDKLNAQADLLLRLQSAVQRLQDGVFRLADGGGVVE